MPGLATRSAAIAGIAPGYGVVWPGRQMERGSLQRGCAPFVGSGMPTVARTSWLLIGPKGHWPGLLIVFSWPLTTLDTRLISGMPPRIKLWFLITLKECLV